MEKTAFGGFYDTHGKPVSRRDAEFVYEKVFKYSGMASECSRQETIDKNVSVKDFCMENIKKDKEVKGDYIKGLITAGLEMLGGIAACDVDKLSLKYFWMEDDLPVKPRKG